VEKVQDLEPLLFINKIIKQFSYMDLEKMKKIILIKLNYNILRN